jgi:hypothetical protein
MEPRIVGDIFLALPLRDGEPSYLVLAGDNLNPGEAIFATISGTVAREVRCAANYISGGDQDYVVVKWPGKGSGWGPGTGEVNVTITVKKQSDEGVIVRRKGRVITIGDGDIPR